MNPSSQSPTLLWDVARLILTAAESGLTTAGLTVPARSIVVAGANSAWDDCCPGQLTVRLARLFVTDEFPNEIRILRAAGCDDDASLVGEYLLELVTCNPSPDSQGNPPKADVLDANAQETLLKAYAVMRGLLCWVAGYGRDVGDTPWSGRAIVRAMEPIGPEGGCVGYLFRVVVELENLCPCESVGEISEGVLLPGVVL